MALGLPDWFWDPLTPLPSPRIRIRWSHCNEAGGRARGSSNPEQSLVQLPRGHSSEGFAVSRSRQS